MVELCLLSRIQGSEVTLLIDLNYLELHFIYVTCTYFLHVIFYIIIYYYCADHACTRNPSSNTRTCIYIFMYMYMYMHTQVK